MLNRQPYLYLLDNSQSEAIKVCEGDGCTYSSTTDWTGHRTAVPIVFTCVDYERKSIDAIFEKSADVH